jgi:serine/threonine protein kinase
MTEGYEILRKLAEGSYGIVYEAEHIKLKRRVALKRLRPEMRGRSDVVERLFREAEVCAKLSHPNIVHVYDSGEDQFGPFIVFELLVGETLAQRGGRQGALAALEVVDIAADALLGLANAHAHGVVHRDIKPANIFLGTRPDGSTYVKLLDFGVSKQPNRKSLTGLTRPGEVVGSLAFMSREQMHQKEVDGRADLYSLGVCMYLMLTGKKPFDATTVQDLLFQLNQPPVPLSRHIPNLPAEFCAVVHRALERERASRYESAASMREALLAARDSVNRWRPSEDTTTTVVPVSNPVSEPLPETVDSSDVLATTPPLMVELESHEVITDITGAVTPDEVITAVDSARRVFDLATVHLSPFNEEPATEQRESLTAPMPLSPVPEESLTAPMPLGLSNPVPAAPDTDPSTRILSPSDLGLAAAPATSTRTARAQMETGPAFNPQPLPLEAPTSQDTVAIRRPPTAPAASYRPIVLALVLIGFLVASILATLLRH